VKNLVRRASKPALEAESSSSLVECGGARTFRRAAWDPLCWLDSRPEITIHFVGYRFMPHPLARRVNAGACRPPPKVKGRPASISSTAGPPRLVPPPGNAIRKTWRQPTLLCLNGPKPHAGHEDSRLLPAGSGCNPIVIVSMFWRTPQSDFRASEMILGSETREGLRKHRSPKRGPRRPRE